MFDLDDFIMCTLNLCIPLQVIFGYYAAKWSQGEQIMRPMLYALYCRYVMAAVEMLIIYLYPTGDMPLWYFCLVIGQSVVATFAKTVQFGSQGAFFAHIADPIIGGTYLTLLNTLSNLGGTYPKYFVLKAVDYMTIATCDKTGKSCITRDEREECTKGGNKCIVYQDGYYIAGISMMLLGFAILLVYIKPNIERLQRIPPHRWRVTAQKVK